MPTTAGMDEAIGHSITASKPHTRYLVTLDSYLLSPSMIGRDSVLTGVHHMLRVNADLRIRYIQYYLSNTLPDRLFDSFIHWFYYGKGYKNFY
jgi:hypothetical protein